MASALTASARGKRFRSIHGQDPVWVERERERQRAKATVRNPRIVKVGIYYVGYAPTPEQASALNQQARDHFAQEETQW